jgi:hypothetical protein
LREEGLIPYFLAVELLQMFEEVAHIQKDHKTGLQDMRGTEAAGAAGVVDSLEAHKDWIEERKYLPQVLVEQMGS